MHKRLSRPIISVLTLALLGGCSTTYISPEPVTAPTLGQPASMMATERTVPIAFDQVWNNLKGYSAERYRTVKQNRARGEMTLFVDAFEPDTSITCGMMQRQNGMFDSHREFLSALAEQTPVNLNVTVNVKLTAKSAKQTLVSVDADYDLAVNYRANPATGAIEGGTRYQFDSTGHAMVNAPQSDFAARCEPTGSVETGFLDAAGGN